MRAGGLASRARKQDIMNFTELAVVYGCTPQQLYSPRLDRHPHRRRRRHGISLVADRGREVGPVRAVITDRPVPAAPRPRARRPAPHGAGKGLAKALGRAMPGPVSLPSMFTAQQ